VSGFIKGRAARAVPDRDHDVRAIGRALLQRAVPALDLRQYRAFDLQFEITKKAG